MKLRPYHTIIIFAILAMSAIFSSVSNYRKAQYAIIKDMDNALALTLQERQDQWITPDTIQSYRSHLSLNLLKQTSILCYAVEEKKNAKEEKRNAQLTSRSMLLDKNHVQGYANCSMLDVFGMSNQRTSMTLSLMAMLWAIWSVYYLRRNRENEMAVPMLQESVPMLQESVSMLQESEEKDFGSLSYSSSEDTFYNKVNHEAIKFTPMQHQLMRMFLENEHHKLFKQEICETLWPKKPDASETLYTLIRRIKPIIENNSNLMIESERGKAYRLVAK